MTFAEMEKHMPEHRGRPYGPERYKKLIERNCRAFEKLVQVYDMEAMARDIILNNSLVMLDAPKIRKSKLWKKYACDEFKEWVGKNSDRIFTTTRVIRNGHNSLYQLDDAKWLFWNWELLVVDDSCADEPKDIDEAYDLKKARIAAASQRRRERAKKRKPKKRGRPKGSKNKPKEPVVEADAKGDEAESGEQT